MKHNILTKSVFTVIAAMVLPSIAQAGQTETGMAPAPQSDCAQGWTLGLEALALRPFQSEGKYNEDDYEFGGRASLGYQFNDGLFTKVTYFGYDAEVFNASGALFRDQGELEVSYLDWVVGQHFKPSDKLTLSPYVGLRWATFEENFSEFRGGQPTQEFVFGSDFSGLGIVVGMDGTRSLGGSFSLYGTAKQSVVFGNSDNTERRFIDGDLDSDNSSSDDRVVSITELGLGVQYDFCFSGFAGNIRAGVEGQYWAGLSDDGNGNTGLGGFVLGANFRF